MEISHDLVVGMAGICTMLFKIFKGDLKVVGIDQVLPLRGQMLSFGRI